MLANSQNGKTLFVPVGTVQEDEIGDNEITVYKPTRTASPIVLDLTGNGVLDAPHGGKWRPHPAEFDNKRAVMFDIDNDGKKEKTEWIGPGDGLLCIPDKNGKATGKKGLFGDGGGFANGYEKLAAIDKNGDGKLTVDELAGLSVWQDKNGNAKVDEGELKSVKSLGITEISVRHNDHQSTFTINRQIRKTWDWWPTYVE